MSDTLRNLMIGSRAGKAVYGIIIALALVITLETHPPSALEAELTLLLGALAVAIAEFYSEYLQARIDQRNHLSRETVSEIASHVGTVMVAALLPIPIFILSSLGVLTIDFAFTFIKWMLVALLFIYSYTAVILGGGSIRMSLVLGTIVGMIGLIVVLAKAALSH